MKTFLIEKIIYDRSTVREGYTYQVTIPIVVEYHFINRLTVPLKDNRLMVRIVLSTPRDPELEIYEDGLLILNNNDELDSPYLWDYLLEIEDPGVNHPLPLAKFIDLKMKEI